MTKQKTEKWEKEFNQLLDMHDKNKVSWLGQISDIRNFIRNQRKELLEGVRMEKLKLPKTPGLGLANDIIERHEWSYNQAVDALNAKIKKLEE